MHTQLARNGGTPIVKNEVLTALPVSIPKVALLAQPGAVKHFQGWPRQSVGILPWQSGCSD